MVELPLDQVPRDGEIVEVFYRLSHFQHTYVDLTLSSGGGVRRLRFNGARVVTFKEAPPDNLLGLDVQDGITEQQPPDTPLWVSVADGAITFWAKSITELTLPKFEHRDPPPVPSAEEVPLVLDEQVQKWGPSGVVPGSFRYHPRALRGALRALVIETEPHPDYVRRPFNGYRAPELRIPEVKPLPAIRKT
jgi:hypothetical protein